MPFGNPGHPQRYVPKKMYPNGKWKFIDKYFHAAYKRVLSMRGCHRMIMESTGAEEKPEGEQVRTTQQSQKGHKAFRRLMTGQRKMVNRLFDLIADKVYSVTGGEVSREDAIVHLLSESLYGCMTEGNGGEKKWAVETLLNMVGSISGKYPHIAPPAKYRLDEDLEKKKDNKASASTKEDEKVDGISMNVLTSLDDDGNPLGDL